MNEKAVMNRLATIEEMLGEYNRVNRTNDNLLAIVEIGFKIVHLYIKKSKKDSSTEE